MESAIIKPILLSLALAACGGIVNYSPDGGEGGSGALGGGGAGPGPGPTNTTTNAQSMVAVTTGPENTCELFCAQFGQCFDAQCFEICESIYVPGCESQAEVYLACIIDANPPNCEFEEGLCPAEETAYGQCVNGSSCFSNECSQSSDGSCSCFGECNGVQVEQVCAPALTGGGGGTSVGASTGGAPPPPQDLFCNCIVAGDYVGDCFEDGFDGCGLEHGCCQQYLT